jgi:exonuclease III
MLIDKSIYLFEKSVSFVRIIGSINVYYSVNSIVYLTFISNSLPSLSLYSSINLNSTFFFIQIATPLELLVPLLKSHKLIDIWRQKNKTKTQFTWNRKDKSEATRIDYFLVSTEILMNSHSSDIRPIVLKFMD